MEKRQKNQRLVRERAVYDYLEALENGDIDGLIETLQQAVYDAPLDELLVDAHHAYFQHGQAGQDELAEVDTRVDLPSFVPLAPRAPRGEQLPQRRRFSLWARTLAAVLVVAVLIGSFVTVLTLYRTNAHPTHVSSPPAVCKALPWQVSSTNIAGALYGIAASSPVDAWAVGQAANNSPLIMHWDGQKWSEVRSPQLRGKGGYLQAIAIVAPNDIWAAGEQYKQEGAGTGMVSQVSGSTTLIEHWDGRHWAIVTNPDHERDPQSAVVVNAITVVSAHDIWITGAWITNQDVPTALIEHWDGQKWTLVLDQSRALENGTPARASVLWTTTIAGGQVLAGGAQMGSDKLYHAYLERWDGQKWQQVDVSSLGQNASAIVSLSAVSADDIWAVVQHATSGQGAATAFAHWDGKTWKQVSAPAWLVGQNTYTQHILALSNTNVWAMNNYSPSVLAHWDGKSWSQVRLPASTLNQDTFSIDFAVSAGATWVVGRSIGKDGSSIHPLLEQQVTCP
ncbi:MAG TPA: hypothetical protein VF043_10340 [Ktedonobacteraceae bacterium]